MKESNAIAPSCIQERQPKPDWWRVAVEAACQIWEREAVKRSFDSDNEELRTMRVLRVLRHVCRVVIDQVEEI
ncbi:hypothetical protein OsJ_06829 [Oryza sativa Japonica Group]|uniref:Uncharacterized protein n=1 Tax=Oryza sativa subsp. japonica TaxID=39947 RepID=B9F051_ORYSJ|nr:hypothetical protein OsJ_06829 [Oryza sativa Japonica Group]